MLKNLFLTGFGLTKVPMLFFLQPRVISLTEEKYIIKIPLVWRSKNHLNFDVFWGFGRRYRLCRELYSAFVPSAQPQDPVARFELTLSALSVKKQASHV